MLDNLATSPNHLFLPPFNPPRSETRAYIRLVRLDESTGVIYAWSPHIIGAIHAAITLRKPPSELFIQIILLLPWALLIRSAGVVWNDTYDCRSDRPVRRRENHPIVSGAISIRDATTFAVLLGASAVAYAFKFLPTSCWGVVLFMCAGTTAYPFIKRLSHFPQGVFAILWGSCIATGEFFVLGSGQSTPGNFLSGFLETLFKISPSSPAETLAQLDIHQDFVSASFLFLAYVCLVVVYETVHSYQDMAGDEAAGMMNIALMTPKKGKVFLIMFGAFGVVSLIACGVFMDASEVFYYAACVAVCLSVATSVWRVRLDDPASCGQWFYLGGMMTNMSLLVGIGLEYGRKGVFPV